MFAKRKLAMVSKLTFADAVEAHSKFLRGDGKRDQARAGILKFLEWDEPAHPLRRSQLFPNLCGPWR